MLDEILIFFFFDTDEVLASDWYVIDTKSSISLRIRRMCRDADIDCQGVSQP